MLKKEVILKDGWYWPSKDMKCWPWLQNEKDLPAIIASHCKDKNIKSGFVHIPLMESQTAEFPGLPVLSIEMMLKATKIMIAEVQRQ